MTFFGISPLRVFAAESQTLVTTSPKGFAIWSMGSLWLSDIDPAAATDDDRQVVEGVSVGVPAFFGF
jgi:hypothetical protein